MPGLRLLSFLIPLLWGAAAHADVTARYHVWGPLGPSMTIEVADNGDARLSLERGGTAAIRRNGIVYLTRGDAQGAFVLRLDEFARIEARKERESVALPPELANMPPLQLTEHGTEQVAGRTGTVVAFGAPGEAIDHDWSFVVSHDPDLAPVGPLVGVFFGGAGTDTLPTFMRAMNGLFADGAVIRMGFMLRLEQVDHAPIPASAFELPGPELSGEEAERRLGPAW